MRAGDLSDDTALWRTSNGRRGRVLHMYESCPNLDNCSALPKNAGSQHASTRICATCQHRSETGRWVSGTTGDSSEADARREKLREMDPDEVPP